MRDFSRTGDHRLFNDARDGVHDLIQGLAYSESCFPFYNEILNHLKQSLLKDTYIDSLDRDFQLRKSTDPKRRLPYVVDVNLPLSWESKDTRLVYEAVHMVSLVSFFHAYQLVFSCRCLRVNAVVAGIGADKYYPLVTTFSSYNVHMYEGYASEFRDDVTESISIHKWTLPGSAYVLTLKPKAICSN